ncbi:MAG: hypothetical protein ACP5RP_01930 [Candidatus Micrarchaeia archaeon]
MRFTIKTNNTNIALDKNNSGADYLFVSHAHSDHISGIKTASKIISSSETADIIKAAYHIDITYKISIPKGIELLNAGHILGAKQLYMEDNENGFSLLYTGDFQTYKQKTVEQITPKNADILVIDSTYPSPKIKFEDRDKVEHDIQTWSLEKLKTGIVLFSAYAVGKAQELTSILNDCGIVPIVSRKINDINKVYNKFGSNLEYVSAYDGENSFEDAFVGNFVGITDSRNVEDLGFRLSKIYGKKVHTAVATGMSKIFSFKVEKAFEFSDHADFYQSLEYIEAVNPKLVATFGHNSELFARNLRAESLNAIPFSELECNGISIAKSRILNTTIIDSI